MLRDDRNHRYVFMSLLKHLARNGCFKMVMDFRDVLHGNDTIYHAQYISRRSFIHLIQICYRHIFIRVIHVASKMHRTTSLRVTHTNALHNTDVIMSVMASQITGVPIVYSTVCSGADQRKYQSAASMAFVRRIHLWPPHKGPVTRRILLFNDVIISWPNEKTDNRFKETDYSASKYSLSNFAYIVNGVSSMKGETFVSLITSYSS